MSLLGSIGEHMGKNNEHKKLIIMLHKALKGVQIVETKLRMTRILKTVVRTTHLRKSGTRTNIFIHELQVHNCNDNI